MAADAADEVVKLGVQLTGANDAAASIAAMEREIAGAADGVRELEAQLKIMQSQKAVDVEQFRAVSGALDDQRVKLAEAQAAYTAMGGAASGAASAARGGLGALEAAAERAAAAAKKVADAEQAIADKAALQERIAAAKEAAAERGAAAAERAAEREADAAEKSAERVAAAAERGAAATERAAEKSAERVAAAAERGAAAQERAAAAAEQRVRLLEEAKTKTAEREAERRAEAAERLADREAAANNRALGSLKEFSTAAGGRLGAVVGTGIELNEKFGNLTPKLKAAAVAIGAIGVAMATLSLVTRGAVAAFDLFTDLLGVVIESADKTGTLAFAVREIKENAKGLFADTNISDFAFELQKAFSFLSATTESGRALRQVLSGAMTEFFDAATKALPYVKQALLGAAIVALQLYIGFRKIANTIGDVVGPIGDMDTALALGKGAAIALAAAIGVIAVVALALFYPLYQGIKIVGQLWEIFARAGADIKATLAAIDLGSIGGAIVDSLIGGIKSNIGDTVAAVTSLADSAVGAMKAALDMHSPSRIFREDIAEHGIGDALVLGFGNSEEKVDAAASDLVEPSAAKSEAMAARGGGRGRPIVYIETLIVQGIEDFRARLAEEMDIAAGSAQGQEA